MRITRNLLIPKGVGRKIGYILLIIPYMILLFETNISEMLFTIYISIF